MWEHLPEEMRMYKKLFGEIGKLLAVSSVLALAIAGPANAGGKLRILTWDGYADKDWVAQFEKDNNATVEVVFAGSNDEMWAKIQGSQGKDFDIFATAAAGMQRYYEAGLLQPIDLSKIPNHAGQLPQFQDLSKIAGAVHDGKTYLIPYAFSPMTLIYDPAKVNPAPTSWSVMWDPQYKGKVLLYDDGESAFATAAILNGVQTPFHLTDQQFKDAMPKLVDLKHNSASFYTFVQDSVQLAQNNDAPIIFGAYADQQIKALAAGGLNYKQAYPKEGVIAWVDTWAVTSGAKGDSYDLALKWINFVISKKIAAELTEKSGYANSVTSTDTIPAGTKIFWMQPDEDPTKRTDLWNQVKATP
ncbi:MAG: extracellular solute-binding protein [Mesorhizobium sp.]|nr:MAG: extracellular solute-binding protein [Mesorhizobium sp.]